MNDHNKACKTRRTRIKTLNEYINLCKPRIFQEMIKKRDQLPPKRKSFIAIWRFRLSENCFLFVFVSFLPFADWSLWSLNCFVYSCWRRDSEGEYLWPHKALNLTPTGHFSEKPHNIPWKLIEIIEKRKFTSFFDSFLKQNWVWRWGDA